jgi:peptidoglycan/xylan/chitin deacetylase (PgdA/CDA1 family)
MKRISPPIFYYHSVAPANYDGWMLDFLTLKLQNFEHQLRYLKQHGYRAIFLDEWLRIRQGNQKSEGNEVCLSFDDGYLDNWVYAFPIAKKYGLKFTLFVSPECIDPRPVVRLNLDNLWNRECEHAALDGLGYLTWAELKNMQESGVVDVQSHTMTHAKYVVSDHIQNFYYGGAEGLHRILNENPEKRHNYMIDPDFSKYLAWGTPLFQKKSSVVAQKHQINPVFTEECLALSKHYNLDNPGKRILYETAARELAEDHRQRGILIQSIESETERIKRLRYEIVESKSIIEAQLGKPVEFMCWPHGENSAETHQMALEAGYKATTAGNLTRETEKTDRIPRIGADFNTYWWFSLQKFHFKIGQHYRRQPFYMLGKVNDLRRQLSTNPA